MECPTCGSTEIELIESSGHAVCIQCGTVLEENTIVSSVEFQESGDRSHVIGQFVSATSSKAYGSASRGNSRYGFSRESREATLANARRNIAQVASSLRLPSYFVDRAQRLYSLALQRNFVYGRRQMHIVATVLYTICRQEKSPHLLIDFSDILQVNVYTLGKSFLQLTKLLNLNLMVVDPSLYIHRFATRLELGDKVGPISTTALRIVSRMKKDWINTGRRPDGVCAAAMLLACRSHDIAKEISEMATIFRVSVITIKKRLVEFRKTPAAQLTLLQFHQHDFHSELDPPIFMKQQQQSAAIRGLRVTFDLSSDFASTGEGGGGNSVNNFDTEDDNGNTLSPSQSTTNTEIFYNDRGQQVQRFVLDGVDITVPLPSDFSHSVSVADIPQSFSSEQLEEGNLTTMSPSPLPSSSMTQSTGKRKAAASSRKLENYYRRRELYSSIYSEMSEVIDASVDSESVRPLDEESELVEQEESFPQLIATQVSTQSNDKTIPTPSDTSMSGSKRKYRQLADALYLESQGVDRYGTPSRSQSEGLLHSNSSSQVNSQSLSTFSSQGSSYIIVRGDGKADSGDGTRSGSQDTLNESFEVETDIDSLFLTQDEQKKKTAIWEKMHRQFLDERLRKRLAREQGENHVTGSSLNKGKMKKEMEASLEATNLMNSTTWGTLAPATITPLTNPATTTKKIRIGASIDSADPNIHGSGHGPGHGVVVDGGSGSAPLSVGVGVGVVSSRGEEKKKIIKPLEKNALGSIAQNILEEVGKEVRDGKEAEEEEEEEVEEEGDEEEALVYEYHGGMDDYDDEGDDEYY